MRFLPKRGPKVWQWFLVQTLMIVFCWIFGAHSSSGDERGLFLLGAAIFVSVIYMIENEKDIGNSAFVVFMLCMLFDSVLDNHAVIAVSCTISILYVMRNNTVAKLLINWYDPVWGESERTERLRKELMEEIKRIKLEPENK